VTVDENVCQTNTSDSLSQFFTVEDGDLDTAQGNKTCTLTSAKASAISADNSDSDNAQRSIPPVCAPYKKPKRPCPYCGLSQLHLKRHIIRKHGTEASVIGSQSLPVTEQKKVFQKLRRQGIYDRNRQIIMQDPNSTKTLLGEKCRRVSNSPRLAMCGNCQGFFAAAHLWRHKRNCTQHLSGSGKPTARDLPAKLMTKMVSAVETGESSFVANVLARFRSDECGSLCVNDKLITSVGQYHYSKSTKKRVLAMSTMQRLGHLLLKFHEACSDDALTGEDMLRSHNFPQLRTAIDLLCSDGNDSLKVAIAYLLKTACDVMKGVYLIENNDLLAKEIDDFKVVLKLFWGKVFLTTQDLT